MIRINNDFTVFFAGAACLSWPSKQFEREEQRLKYESAQAELAAAAAGKHDLAC